MAGGTIDADKIDAYIVDHPSGARALLAPSRPDQASSVTPHLLQEIYTALRPNYDYIVVDTPPGFTAEVITTIDVSTDLVMVGMLDSLSLKNTKLGLETLELMELRREPDPARPQPRAEPRRHQPVRRRRRPRPRARHLHPERPRDPPRRQRRRPDRPRPAGLGGIEGVRRTRRHLHRPASPTAAETSSTRAQQPSLFGRLAGRKA